MAVKLIDRRAARELMAGRYEVTDSPKMMNAQEKFVIAHHANSHRDLRRRVRRRAPRPTRDHHRMASSASAGHRGSQAHRLGRREMPRLPNSPASQRRTDNIGWSMRTGRASRCGRAVRFVPSMAVMSPGTRSEKTSTARRQDQRKGQQPLGEVIHRRARRGSGQTDGLPRRASGQSMLTWLRENNEPVGEGSNPLTFCRCAV